MIEGKARHDARAGTLLVPGDTCWRIERADRLAVIVDAAAYFRHLRAALRAAERFVYLIGWDFDLRLEMLPGESDEEGRAPDGLPNRLGDFLEHVVDAAPDLSLHILKWDKAVLVQLSQQLPETIGLKLSSDRIHFALDSHHPAGATHHQKVVVIDDRMAFCGGIDVTGGRWDTREHLPGDERRHLPNGDPHKPWHDATTALSGPVAAALGDLARTRWRAANGEELGAPAVASAPWPEGLDADLEGVDVAIARTKPRYHEQDRVDEIERLYLAAIRGARRTIYLESQYFAAGSICEALERRLAEPDGPELLVINPDRAEGFLQHEAMDTARARMIERVRDAARRGGGGPDGRGRFRIYHPVNAAGVPIYVHAKVLIVDDRLVRIGSSNVNNRSMGFDTECDVAVEPATEAQRAFALRLRHDLLAEHLGCEAQEVADAAGARSSLLEAVDALNGHSDRCLREIDPGRLNAVTRELGERLLSDERTYPRNRPHPFSAVSHGVRRAVSPYHVEAALAGTVLLAAAVLIGAWAATRLVRRRRRREPAPAAFAPPVRRPLPPPAPPAPRARPVPPRAAVAVVVEPDGDAAVAVVRPVPPRSTLR